MVPKIKYWLFTSQMYYVYSMEDTVASNYSNLSHTAHRKREYTCLWEFSLLLVLLVWDGLVNKWPSRNSTSSRELINRVYFNIGQCYLLETAVQYGISHGEIRTILHYEQRISPIRASSLSHKRNEEHVQNVVFKWVYLKIASFQIPAFNLNLLKFERLLSISSFTNGHGFRIYLINP